VLTEGAVCGLAEQVHQEIPADCVAGGAAPRVSRVRPARVLDAVEAQVTIIIVQFFLLVSKLILMLHSNQKSLVSALTSAVTIGKVSEISKILIRLNSQVNKIYFIFFKRECNKTE